MGIAIKDAQLVSQVTGKEKIPVSDGSGEPKAVTTEQIKEFVGRGNSNVQSDWNEENPNSDAYIKNKPTVPSEVTEQTVTNWGFTKNTGDYSKPSTGIPKSDLDSDVQSSLDKADTALQEHQDISGLATKSELNNKQDKISDLEAIRRGASKGETALQSVPSGYVTTSMLEEAIEEAITNTLAEKV